MSEYEEKPLPIPAGMLFAVTTGEYSDYTVWGVFRALREIDTERLLRLWVNLNPEQANEYDFEIYEFLAYLVRNEYAELSDCAEIYLDYPEDICVSRINRSMERELKEQE